MNNNIQVVLAHPDKQHSFQTAKALLEAGILEKYITTVYDKPGSLTHLLAKLCRGSFKKKLQAHRSSELPDSQVKQYAEVLSLFLLLLVRIDKSKKIYSKLKIFRDKVFNKKVAKYCLKNHVDAVVSYDVVSAQLHKFLGESKILKVLDMSAPHFSYMCSLFEKEIEKHPTSSLSDKLNTPLMRYWKAQSEQEIKSADAFLVASDFTKESLIQYGADPAKIFKCVYGINHELFNSSERQHTKSKTLNCVYVGNVTEQKGFRYLLDAIKKVKNQGLAVDFTIVGLYDPSDVLVAEARKYCTFTGHILPSELKSILLVSDIMIFPSLCDGFGFSVLEAMACGVVPICSRNAGVSDIINDGSNGLIVASTDAKAIYEKVLLLLNDHSLLLQMRENATESASKMTWDNYYVSVSETIKQLRKNVKENDF